MSAGFMAEGGAPRATVTPYCICEHAKNLLQRIFGGDTHDPRSHFVVGDLNTERM